MKKNIIIIVLLVIAVVAVMVLKSRKNEVSSASVSSGISTPISKDAATNDLAVAGTLPRLVDLGADKCVPCKMMMPILDELEKTYAGQLNVEFIDVWKDSAEGEKYGIRTIPTQIFYDADGTEIFRHEGFFPREDIMAKWKEFGFEFLK